MVSLVFIQSLLSGKYPRISAVFNSDLYENISMCLAIKPLSACNISLCLMAD